MLDHLDDIDRLLLTFLQENSARTADQLSKLLQVHGRHLGPAACRNRVDDLKHRGFIKKFAAFLDPDKLNLSHVCFIMVQLGDEKCGDARAAFLSKVSAHPQVIEVHEIFGEFDFLLKTRVHHFSDALNFSQQLRPLVRTIQTLPVGQSHKDTTVLPLALIGDVQ